MNKDEHLMATTLTTFLNSMEDAWFNTLRIGDTVYNYDDKIVKNKLREGIIKEIHNNSRYDQYVIVDNLTTGRRNKWSSYALVKPQEIEDVRKQLHKLLSNIAIVMQNDDKKTESQIAVMSVAQAEYKRLTKQANELLKHEDIQLGKCKGIYGAFNEKTGECVYIGKSFSLINKRWREHIRFWKKDKPIHRQPILTQYLYFFGNQIIWRVLLPIDDGTDNDLVEYCERRVFEKYMPIANSIIPNGTYYGRSVLEGEGGSILLSEQNPNIVRIKIHGGKATGFSDGKKHFEY
jgi:hypothetical protein